MARRALLALAAASAAVLGTAAGPARADVVELRNGTTLEGEVVAETETTVTLRFTGGQVTFERKLVAAIRKEPKPDPAKQETPKTDGPKPDAAKPDGSKPDGTKPDGMRSDGPQFVPPDPVPPPRGKPDAPKPDAPKPDAAKPDAPKPDAAKPDAPKPDAAKADAAKPDAPKPDAPNSELPPSAGITPAKDHWTILWSTDRRTGWCRAQAKIEDGGKSIFEHETAVLGANGKPEGTIRYVEEAGPGFAPLGFLLATDMPGRQTSRSGSIRNGRLIVETWEQGERTVRDFAIPDGLRFPLAARALVLREGSRPGDSWKGPSFDPRTGEFATARIALLRRERFTFEGAALDTVVLSRTLGDETTEERVAADGRVLAVDLGAKGGSAIGTTAARVEALRTSSAEVEASETEQRGRMSLACPEDGFRIRKPGVSWVLVPPESRESRERAAVKDFSGTVGVVVASDPAPAGPEKAPADLGAALEERLRKECSTYVRVEAGAAPLGGSPGWRILADTEHNGDAVRILVHVLARGGRVYTVTARAPRAAFAEARPYLQRILDGIEWL